MSEASVGDTDLSKLAQLKKLSSLNLWSTLITGETAATLAQLSNLKTLSLKETQISDAALAHLSGLTSLEDLSLHKTQITDEGVAHLHGLTNLKKLDPKLCGGISDEAKDKLKAALPNANILF